MLSSLKLAVLIGSCDNSEIEELRARHDVKEAETATLSTQSQAMLNLNLKLQNTALKTQAKAVDLDLAKLQAKVSRQQAEILQVSGLIRLQYGPC